jgi:hypothetical protein
MNATRYSIFSNRLALVKSSTAIIEAASFQPMCGLLATGHATQRHRNRQPIHF